MSTDTSPAHRRLLVLARLAALAVVLVVVGLLLREHAPGDMGTGFLVGAGAAAVVAGVMAWRVSRRPSSATTFERAWTQAGDERDDAVLTRSLAVLGLLALPLTAAAAVAVGLGAAAEVVLTLLLVAQVVVGAVAFAVVGRRS